MNIASFFGTYYPCTTKKEVPIVDNKNTNTNNTNQNNNNNANTQNQNKTQNTKGDKNKTQSGKDCR